MRAVKPDFLLLKKKDNQRFDYAGKSDADFSTLRIGETTTIELYNMDLDRKEYITFECTHNQFFETVGRRIIHGLVKGNGDFFQIEFSVKNCTISDAQIFWRDKPVI